MSHILAAVDLSDVTQAVVREAELIAQALSAKLTLMHVSERNPQEFIGFPASSPSALEDRTRRLAAEQADLNKLAAELRYRGIQADAIVVEGPPAKSILQQADTLCASLIVLGTHGHGMLYHALVGGTSAEVIKESSRPVLVVPDPRPGRRECD